MSQRMLRRFYWGSYKTTQLMLSTREEVCMHESDKTYFIDNCVLISVKGQMNFQDNERNHNHLKDIALGNTYQLYQRPSLTKFSEVGKSCAAKRYLILVTTTVSLSVCWNMCSWRSHDTFRQFYDHVYQRFTVLFSPWHVYIDQRMNCTSLKFITSL